MPGVSSEAGPARPARCARRRFEILAADFERQAAAAVALAARQQAVQLIVAARWRWRGR